MAADRKFAAGRNEHEGRSCPAVTAGFSEGDEKWNRVFLERFDNKLDALPSEPKIVDEATARKAWLEAIGEAGSESRIEKFGEAVAEKLGWT